MPGNNHISSTRSIERQVSAVAIIENNFRRNLQNAALICVSTLRVIMAKREYRVIRKLRRVTGAPIKYSRGLYL